MKRKELYTCFESLNEVGDLKGVKFAYSVIKNKNIIEEEIKILEEVVKANPEFEKYEMERIKLCELHSEKNDEGKAIIENDKYKIIDQIKFDEELNVLKEKYNEHIQERINQINEYNKMLDEDIDLEFTKLGVDDLPENISAIQLEPLKFMINL